MSGLGDKMKGSMKEFAGKVTGNEELEARGKVDQIKGDLKDRADDAKQAVSDKASELREKAGEKVNDILDDVKEKTNTDGGGSE